MNGQHLRVKIISSFFSSVFFCEKHQCRVVWCTQNLPPHLGPNLGQTHLMKVIQFWPAQSGSDFILFESLLPV